MITTKAECFNSSYLDDKWEPLIELCRCESCRKEFSEWNLATIAAKWKDEKGKGYWGRYIYSCKDCFDKNLEAFKKNMVEGSELIVSKHWKEDKKEVK